MEDNILHCYIKDIVRNVTLKSSEHTCWSHNTQIHIQSNSCRIFPQLLIPLTLQFMAF